MSGLLVTFACGRIRETNKDNVNENAAMAYVSITGVPYPADEKDEGEEVCRVWLLNEGRFLVTWIDEYYKRSDMVKDRIELAKKDLGDYYLQKTGQTDKKYCFICTVRREVAAKNITEALEKMDRGEYESQYESMPFENGPGRYDHIIRKDDDNIIPMQKAVSQMTGNVIWYEPGCPNGSSNCVFDPMKGIAENCGCQDELTAKKQAMCGRFKKDSKGLCRSYKSGKHRDN